MKAHLFEDPHQDCPLRVSSVIIDAYFNGVTHFNPWRASAGDIYFKPFPHRPPLLRSEQGVTLERTAAEQTHVKTACHSLKISFVSNWDNIYMYIYAYIYIYMSTCISNRK
jgi:hypothetical protein